MELTSFLDSIPTQALLDDCDIDLYALGSPAIQELLLHYDAAPLQLNFDDSMSTISDTEVPNDASATPNQPNIKLEKPETPQPDVMGPNGDGGEASCDVKPPSRYKQKKRQRTHPPPAAPKKSELRRERRALNKACDRDLTLSEVMMYAAFHCMLPYTGADLDMLVKVYERRVADATPQHVCSDERPEHAPGCQG